MWCNDNGSLVDGHNPRKKLVLRSGLVGSLWLIAGLAAAALSWSTSPECVNPPPPPDCGDHERFCHDPDVFLRNRDCTILAHSCMKTCGCCTDSPEGWCPNKVPTQWTLMDHPQVLLVFFGFLLLFSVICMSKLCCSPSTPTCKKAVLIISIVNACFGLMVASLWVAYSLTDCQGKFRGISDVLFFVSASCCICALVMILIALAWIPTIATYGALLANMAEQRRCGDPNLLVLDVSTDRVRRFLADEQHQGAALTVQTPRSCCSQSVRVFALLLVCVFSTSYLYLGVLNGGVLNRGACFTFGFYLIVAVLAMIGSILRSKTYVDYQKHRGEQQWLQELEVPQQLLLFYNGPTPMQGSPEITEAQSVISLGTRREFFFEPVPQVADTPGAFKTITHTRILQAEGQTGDVLEFKSVVKAQNPGLFGRVCCSVTVHAESVARMPLEPHHVPQVRAWLQERQSIFEFETAREVEMTQPEA